jgi:hypothetical protein
MKKRMITFVKPVKTCTASYRQAKFSKTARYIHKYYLPSELQPKVFMADIKALMDEDGFCGRQSPTTFPLYIIRYSDLLLTKRLSSHDVEVVFRAIMAYFSDYESDLTDDEDRAALNLNAWLVDWEKSLLEEGLRLREEMEGQVNSGNGWLSDYEFDLEVSFYVRDDDPYSPVNYPDASEHDVDRDASMLCSTNNLFFILKRTARPDDYWGIGGNRDHSDWHGSCRKGSIYEAKHCTTFHELCSHMEIPMKHMGRIGRIWTDITIFRQNFADVPKDGKEGISISHKSHKL